MKIGITHLTTACTLLEIGPLRILTDPVLDSGVQTYRLGPGAKATRYVGPAVDPRALPPIDAALVSHAHPDNLDKSGMGLLARVPLVLGERHAIGHLPPATVALAPWESHTIVSPHGFRIKVTATPAQHGPSWLPGVRDVIGFVLEWPGQAYGPLYISGDTVFFPGLRQIQARFERIGTALLHLGAVHFWPPWPPCLRFTFNAREAARCAQLLQLRTMIPIHYERSVWSHFREPLDTYRRTFHQAGLDNIVHWLRPGERTEIEV